MYIGNSSTNTASRSRKRKPNNGGIDCFQPQRKKRKMNNDNSSKEEREEEEQAEEEEEEEEQAEDEEETGNILFADKISEILFNHNGYRILELSIPAIKNLSTSNQFMKQFEKSIDFLMNKYKQHSQLLMNAFSGLKETWNSILSIPPKAFEKLWKWVVGFFASNDIPMIIQRRNNIFVSTDTGFGIQISIVNFGLIMLLSGITCDGDKILQLMETIYLLFNSALIASLEMIKSKQVELLIHRYFSKQQITPQTSSKAWTQIITDFTVSSTNESSINELLEMVFQGNMHNPTTIDQILQHNNPQHNTNNNNSTPNIARYIETRITGIIQTPLNVTCHVSWGEKVCPM